MTKYHNVTQQPVHGGHAQEWISHDGKSVIKNTQRVKCRDDLVFTGNYAQRHEADFMWNDDEQSPYDIVAYVL